jgi:flagellar protein FlbT
VALQLTLKPNEQIVINGCVIRNADRRQTLTVENQADVVRGVDLLDELDAATPVKEVYFFIQSALLRPEIRDDISSLIQSKLGQLVPVFHDEIAGHIFEAANHLSTRNYYKAMRALRHVIEYEAELLRWVNEGRSVTAAE